MSSLLCQPLARKKNTDSIERRALSTAQKQEYISAVQCLQTAPAQLSHLYPGSKSRFDDFQAAHIELTPLIHWNVSFKIPP